MEPLFDRYDGGLKGKLSEEQRLWNWNLFARQPTCEEQALPEVLTPYQVARVPPPAVAQGHGCVEATQTCCGECRSRGEKSRCANAGSSGRNREPQQKAGRQFGSSQRSLHKIKTDKERSLINVHKARYLFRI